MIKELQIGTETYFICLAAKKGKLFFSSFKPKYIVLKQNKSIGYITSLMFPLSEMPRLDK